MHSKNNNKTQTFVQGLRPFSSSIPKTLKKHLRKGGYNYSAIVDDKDVFIKTFFMPIPLNKYQEGKHIITIEKLFYEGYEYVNPERYGYAISSDSTVLVKAADSLIHIPFYIYR